MPSWVTPNTLPLLLPENIHIWRASLEVSLEVLDFLWKCLSTDEQCHANTFVVEKPKRNFIISRGILRLLLSYYGEIAYSKKSSVNIKPKGYYSISTKIDPAKIIFHSNEYGKPFIVYPKKLAFLKFNISHSNNLALLAFTPKHQIGIDLEWIQPDFDYAAIATQFFSSQEKQALFSLPKSAQLKAFFNLWVRKEAFLKAIGKGLSVPLDSFSANLSNQKETFEIDYNKQPYWVSPLCPAQDYTAALVTTRSPYKIQKLIWKNN